MPSYTVGPAWQLAESFGSQSDTVIWTAYRSIGGNPKFTVTNIDVYSGTFYRCFMKIDLLDSGNRLHGSGSLTKYWGQDASCSLGSIGASKSLKLRTTLNIWKNTAGQRDASGTWTAVLSF